jgi:hypothetical protein
MAKPSKDKKKQPLLKQAKRKPSKKKQKQIDKRNRYKNMMETKHKEIKELKTENKISSRIRYCKTVNSEKIPCCQYRKEDGELCSRVSMLDGKTYIAKFDCCYLCWQHASLIGLYGVLSFAKFAQDQQLSYSEYYSVYPEELLKLPEQGKESITYVKKIINKLYKKNETDMK